MLLACSVKAHAQYWTDPYDVLWTTPGKDAAGSMPLGNGEVGINLWVEENGDLNFYISRSDSFSEIGRLLKVGQLKVSITPNPFLTGAKFEQRLHLHDGVCEITAGEGAKKVSLKIFVGSDSPDLSAVHVVGESAAPISVKATVISWRTERRVIPKAEQKSSWTMRDCPYDLVESADVFSKPATNSVMWYHRNEESVVPATIKLQSLESLADKIHDPLLHRSFGGVLMGRDFIAVDDHGIQTTADVKSFSLEVAVFCRQTLDINDGLNPHPGDSPDSTAAALRQTIAWWHAFWDRSWIITNAGGGITVPVNKHEFRFGVDSNGQNQFPGTLRPAVFNVALSPADIATLAATGMDQPSVIVADKTPDFTHSFTLSAWMNPDRLESGRIFDKLTAGTDDGFLFDTYPGNTLRLIVGNTTLTAPPDILTTGKWQHVAATVDIASGSLRIYLDGKPVAENVPDGVSPIARALTLQRYVQACGGRGNFPIKFNGGIFTVEPRAMGLDFNGDYRAWGECYWWQNTRHMYHPMFASGDVEMTDPLFNMYEAARPVCEARAMLYHRAKGCYFPETMTSWGTYSNGDYGWDRRGHKPSDVMCPYWQYAWNQGPELVGLLLDRWDYTKDPDFLKKMVLPMAQSVLSYFETRFDRLREGRLVLEPTQSVETFWHDVTNDMPTVAGLNDITTRLCNLPTDLTTTEQRAFFERMKKVCPQIPTEDRTVDGQPVRMLAPAQRYNPSRSNCENPELYAVWPFRLFGIGKPNLDEAVAAYTHRTNHLDVGWGYDGNCAALLGLTDEAGRIINAKAANSRGGYRWPATWGPNFDWLPDQNHGGNLLETAQLMLLQCDGSKIRLLPAWPKQWDVSFKLHATGNTEVDCVFRAGKIAKLRVTPAERTKDVILPPE